MTGLKLHYFEGNCTYYDGRDWAVVGHFASGDNLTNEELREKAKEIACKQILQRTGFEALSVNIYELKEDVGTVYLDEMAKGRRLNDDD